MKITEIQIIPIKPNNGLVAFASCVIDKWFYVGNIAIYTSPKTPYGFRLVYPLKTLPNGKQINCFHPITKETGQIIQTAIVNKFLELSLNV